MQCSVAFLQHYKGLFKQKRYVVKKTPKKVSIRNYYGDAYKVGERVGQIIILPYPQILFEEAEKLSETKRGTGGYGSTGK